MCVCVYIYIYIYIYNALVLTCNRSEIKKILRRNQNGFWRNRTIISEILTICRMIERVRAKIQEATLFFVYFFKPFVFIHRGRWSKYSYLPTPPLGQDMTQGQF